MGGKWDGKGGVRERERRMEKEWDENTGWRKGMGKDGGGNQGERKKPSCGVAPKSDRG